jgi:hypothetical protein
VFEIAFVAWVDSGIAWFEETGQSTGHPWGDSALRTLRCLVQQFVLPKDWLAAVAVGAAGPGILLLSENEKTLTYIVRK